jgi:hypothetical protein
MGREFLLLCAFIGGPVLLSGLIGEAAAAWRVHRIRKRDGGIPAPRSDEEYLLFFPRACPTCLSRDLWRVRGWHIDGDGAKEWVETDQCARCGFVRDGRLPSPIREAHASRDAVEVPPRWFVSWEEAGKIAAPRHGSLA